MTRVLPQTHPLRSIILDKERIKLPFRGNPPEINPYPSLIYSIIHPGYDKIRTHAREYYTGTRSRNISDGKRYSRVTERKKLFRHVPYNYKRLTLEVAAIFLSYI